jgi:hypothetical protein
MAGNNFLVLPNLLNRWWLDSVRRLLLQYLKNNLIESRKNNARTE